MAVLCLLFQSLFFKAFMQKRGRGYYDSPSKIFSHSNEAFRRGTFLCCFRKFPVVKKFMDDGGWGGVSRFSVEICSCHSTETFLRRTLQSFRKIPVSEKLMDERGCLSRFSVDYFLFSQYRDFCRGTLLCFRKFLVSKNFRDKRDGGWRDYDDFGSKIRCLSVPKNIVGEPFLVSEKFWYQKF